MRWRKRKAIDLSAVELPEATAPPDLSALPDTGPAVHVPLGAVQPPAALDRERDWAALGPRAWNILRRRRMQDLFQDGSRSEFERYLEVLARSPGNHREEIFIGLQHPGCQPQFVPRRVFQNHAYILGGSGQGKTSHAMAQLLIQLAQEYTDRRGRTHPGPPILIMELKQNGDRYLRALAQRVAEARGQKLLFFSDEPAYESMTFDPLDALWRTPYPIKRLETLLKAFSLVYPEGYGSDFFTSEQRVQLEEILLRDRPRTYDELVECIRLATRDGRSANSDARGLYSAMSTLRFAYHVHTDDSPLDPACKIDFQRFFEERQILYVHLDARSLPLLSRDIAKLMLFGLVETAAERERHQKKVQAFVFLDEFHRLAARNIVEMLEDARGAGVGFVLAHQSSSSLQTRDADLYGILFENCSFKQCLTLEDPRVIDLFRAIAPRTTETRHGGSTSQTKGNEVSTGRTWGSSDTVGKAVTSSWNDSSTTKSEGSSHSQGGSYASSQSESTTDAHSWHEELVSAVTPEVIQAVNDINLLALVHVKGVGEGSQTPTHSVPTLVQGLYPVTETQARAMESEPWPLQPVDPEEFYRKVRPRIPALAVAALSARPSGRIPAAAGQTGHPRPADAAPRGDRGVREKLQARLLAIAQRHVANLLRPAISVEAFARGNHLAVAAVLSALQELGTVAGMYDRLQPRVVALLKRKLRETGQLPPEKDNGPQKGPVV